MGQAVGQILGGAKTPTLIHNSKGSEKIFTTNKSGSKSGSNLNACTLAYKCKSHIYSILRNYIIVTLVISHT